MGYPLIYLGSQPVIRAPFGAMYSGWTRPTEWPALTSVAGKELVVGLFGVEDTDANHVALLTTTSTGTYYVNWGDGTLSAACTSNTQVEKSYSYNVLSSYPLWNGYRLVQISLSANTGNLIGVSLQRKPSGGTLSALPASTGVNWLELDMNIPNATALTIGNNTNVTPGILQRVRIRQNSITSFSNLFNSCYNLRSVQIDTMSACNTVNGMFVSCYNLVDAPALSTNNVTDFTSMFFNCQSLMSVPAYDTSKGTTFTQMFYGCRSLQTVPLFDTSKGTNFFAMFQNCGSLIGVPKFNTLSGETLSYMFNSCATLYSIPLLDTRSARFMDFMFSGCNSLTNIPLLNTTNVVSMSSMFQNCLSMQSVPPLSTSNVTSMQSMFLGCMSLTAVPNFDTAKVTTVGGMFNACYNLVNGPSFNLSACTNFGTFFNNCFNLSQTPYYNARAGNAVTNVFNGCRSLSLGGLSAIKFSHSYTNCRLSRNALVTIFNNLTTASGAQTITITGNYGAITLTPADRAIATGKGWTITG